MCSQATVSFSSRPTAIDCFTSVALYIGLDSRVAAVWKKMKRLREMTSFSTIKSRPIRPYVENKM